MTPEHAQKLKNWLIVGGTLGFIAIAIFVLIQQKQKDAAINKAMLGEVRGNARTHVFHVPTCPQYNSVAPDNVRVFNSVREAQAAGFTASMNCLAAVESRRLNEEESSDTETTYDR